MRDRRGSPRYRCNLRCELRRASKLHPALLVDVSRSGLSVQVDHELAQGDEVELCVERGIQIRAIAWRSRPNRGGFVVGMMLSDVSAAYEALVERCEARGRPPARRVRLPLPPAPVRPAEPTAPVEAAAPERWWRLRVKETDGPRTRTVMLAAPSRSDALEKAIAELGAGWEVIEVQAKVVEEPKDS